MNVVHLSLTPLAGAPIRLVKALNRFTDFNSVLVNYNPSAYGTRTYDEDVVFSKNPEYSRKLIISADIIHCHHWFDLHDNPFGVDISKKLVVRHFHSAPAFIANHAGIDINQVIFDPLPQLVVAQFQERLYPFARPVPNLIDFSQIDRVLELTHPLKTEDERELTIMYSPTTGTSALSERWDTKGAPETEALLKQFLGEGNAIRIDRVTDSPLFETLQRRATADLVIDEMVTGSYHLSGLESLALGKPTLGYLDQRMIAVLVRLTGSDSLPWVNVHLSELLPLLDIFVNNRQLIKMVGDYSKKWMRQYWNEADLVSHYEAVYRDILSGVTRLRLRSIESLPDIFFPDFNWTRLTGRLQ